MAYTTIDKPSDYFETKLYTGTGSELAITGVGFQPDLIWFKQRSAVRNHALVDSVRGRSKVVFPDLTNAEETSAASTNDLVSFDSDGFTVGITNVSGSFNTSSGTHVAWNWLGGGTASSNTDGSITSRVSANTTAGFSIVSYTGNATSGATVAHGLGVTPAMMIVKNRSAVEEWGVYHVSNGNTHVQYLNTTGAKSDDAGFWNDTTPTSSVFTVGNSTRVNQNGSAIIAYCFAEKQGYSKFGSYTGNGNADGTFVYTGFKPAFVMLKKTSGTGNWQMFDDKRVGYNPDNDVLRANLSNTECTSCVKIDTLSNGFKLRNTDGDGNTSGGTYIYMSFASEPFTTSTTNGSIPATAR